MFNTLSFPMANMFACADMIYGGVMERFPKLKVAFLEGNCAWLPWLLWRMGEYAELTGAAEHPEMKLAPLEYFQRQCWGAVECDEHVAKIHPRIRPRRQHRLLHRLPASRRKISPRRGELSQNALH